MFDHEIYYRRRIDIHDLIPMGHLPSISRPRRVAARLGLANVPNINRKSVYNNLERARLKDRSQVGSQDVIVHIIAAFNDLNDHCGQAGNVPTMAVLCLVRLISQWMVGE
jgi:hypothetical protein